MKAKLVMLTIGSSLLLAVPALRAEDKPAPTTPPAGHARKEMRAEHSLLPPMVVEKLNLTEDQKAKIKPIEESFAKTEKEYYDAHKADIDAARTAAKDARQSGDKEKIRAAREQMQKANEGLAPQRKAAMEQVKSLLTDEQKKILEESRPGPGGRGPGGKHAPKN